MPPLTSFRVLHVLDARLISDLRQVQPLEPGGSILARQELPAPLIERLDLLHVVVVKDVQCVRDHVRRGPMINGRRERINNVSRLQVYLFRRYIIELENCLGKQWQILPSGGLAGKVQVVLFEFRVFIEEDLQKEQKLISTVFHFCLQIATIAEASIDWLVHKQNVVIISPGFLCCYKLEFLIVLYDP